MRISNIAVHVSLLCLLVETVSTFQSKITTTTTRLSPKATKNDARLETTTSLLATSGSFKAGFKSFLVGPGGTRRAAVESSSSPPSSSSVGNNIIPESIVPSTPDVVVIEQQPLPPPTTTTTTTPMEALSDKLPGEEVVSSLKMPSLSLPEEVSSLKMPSLPDDFSLFDDVSILSRLRDATINFKLPSVSMRTTPTRTITLDDITLPDASDVKKFMTDLGFQFRPLEVDLSGVSDVNKERKVNCDFNGLGVVVFF